MSERPKAASKARRLLRERRDLLDDPATRHRDDEIAAIDRAIVDLVPLLLNVIENNVKATPWHTERRKRQDSLLQCPECGGPHPAAQCDNMG